MALTEASLQGWPVRAVFTINLCAILCLSGLIVDTHKRCGLVCLSGKQDGEMRSVRTIVPMVALKAARHQILPAARLKMAHGTRTPHDAAAYAVFAMELLRVHADGTQCPGRHILGCKWNAQSLVVTAPVCHVGGKSTGDARSCLDTDQKCVRCHWAIKPRERKLSNHQDGNVRMCNDVGGLSIERQSL